MEKKSLENPKQKLNMKEILGIASTGRIVLIDMYFTDPNTAEYRSFLDLRGRLVYNKKIGLYFYGSMENDGIHFKIDEDYINNGSVEIFLE